MSESRLVEIILTTIVIILMLITLGIMIYYNEDSKIRDQNIQNNLSELNSNVIQLIPIEPKIIVSNFAKNITGSELSFYEEVGYFDCIRDIVVPIEDNKNYERVAIFLENAGKKVNDLRVKISCSSDDSILAICTNSNNIEIESERLLVNFDGIIRINELDSITSEYVDFIYPSKIENCTLEYDSQDLKTGESQSINITHL